MGKLYCMLNIASTTTDTDIQNCTIHFIVEYVPQELMQDEITW